MSDSYTIANQIKSVLRYIGDTFINSSQQTIYIGAISADDLSTKTDASQLNFVEALVKGYTDFKTRYSTSLPNTVDSTVLDKIMVRNLNQATYQPIGANLNPGTFSPTEMELNYSKVLTNVSGTEGLLNTLNKIKNTYTFLSETVLRKYTGGLPFYVSNYAIDATNKSHIQITSENKTEFLNKIREIIGDVTTFDFIKNDVFMIRRLLLLYELMANIYISMYLYEKAALTNGISDSLKTGLNNNLSNAGNVLINLNQNFTFTSDDNTPSVRTSIVKTLNNSIQKYNASSKSINQLDENVKELKITLNNNNYLLESGLSLRKTASKYEKIVRIILIVSVIAIVSVAIIPFEKTVKLYMSGAIFIFIIVSAVLLDWLYRRRIEGFEDIKENFYVCSTGGLLPNTANAMVGCSIAEVNTILLTYNQSYLSEMLKFLNITIYIGVILQSNKSYVGMDSAIQREINYFNQMQNMIDNSNNKVYNNSMIARFDALISTARVTFFISLAIIITASVMAFIIIGEDKRYQPFIIAVAGLLLVIIVMKYLYDTMRRVRSDPSKFYWKEPTDIDKLSTTTTF